MILQGQGVKVNTEFIHDVESSLFLVGLKFLLLNFFKNYNAAKREEMAEITLQKISIFENQIQQSLA